MPRGKYERTPEIRKRIAQSNWCKGRQRTQEAIEKYKKTRLQASSEGRGIGWNHTDDAKKKIGEGSRKNWQNPEYVKKAQTKSDPETWKRNVSLGMKKMIANLPQEEQERRFARYREEGAKARAKKREITETKPERMVREYLERSQIAYLQEYQVNQLHVDFFLPKYNLIIEVDGEYWHSLEEAKEKDKRRDYFLRSLGFRIIRLREFDIYDNVENAFSEALVEILKTN